MSDSTLLSTVIACVLWLCACAACKTAAAVDAPTPVERVAQPRGGSSELRLAKLLRLSQEIADSLPAAQRANVERLPRALVATDELAIDEVIWASTTAESDRAIARILGLAIELGDDRVRHDAISKLYEHDLVYGEVLPAVIRTLLDNDIPTQSWAFMLLQRFGPDAAPAVPALLAALKKDDSATRSGACDVLASIGHGAAPALAALVRATHDEDRGVRESAVYAIAALGPLAEKALPRLTEILQGDDHATVRGSAARAIAAVDAERTDSVAILIEALMDDDGFVREAAATALGDLGRAAASAAKALTDALEDDSLGVRVAAAQLLRRVSNDAATSVATLVHVLEVGDIGERTSAVRALGAMGPKAQGAVAALATVLDDKNEWFAAHGDSTHELAIDALGRVGIAAAPAVPHLIRKLEDDDERIRARAAVALWRIERFEKSLTLLVDTLGNDDALPVYPALEALRDIGPDAIQAVPEIVKLQRHELRGIRERAAAALEAIGAPHAAP